MSNDGLMDEPRVSPEAYNSIRPEAYASESLGAMFKLSAMDTTTNAISQYSEIDAAEKQGGEVIAPKDLNELYPDLGIPFTEPKNKAVAEIIAARQRKRQELGEIIASGPQGKLMGAARFGAALIPHAIDPINIGSGVAISALTAGLGVVKNIGQATAGAEAALGAVEAANAARAVGIAGRVLSNPFIRHAGEGVIGNVATETLVARAAIQEGREYNLDDAFYNTVGGALLVPGVIWGGQKALQGLHYTGKFAINRTAEYLGRIDPKYSEVLQATSVARLLDDKLPAPGVFHEHAVAELSGSMPKWAGQNAEYSFQKFNGEVPGRPVYAATYDPGPLGSVHTESFDHYLGDAVYVTDDPRVANGAASRGFKDGNGQVVELNTTDKLNLINLDEKAPESLRDVFSGLGITKKELDGMTVGDLVQKFQDEMQTNARNPDFFEGLNNALKEKGFDGYVSDGSKIEGQVRDPHNSMVVFNKDKLSEAGRLDPDVEAVGTLKPERLQALQEESMSEVSQLGHENPQQILRDFDNTSKEPVKSLELKELEANELMLHEELGELKKQDLLDERELKIIDEVQAAQKDSETLTTMLKYAASCVGLD